MQPHQIYPTTKYLSVHDVLYHVERVENGEVFARCVVGRGNKLFKMQLERFAQTMKSEQTDRRRRLYLSAG